MAVICRCDGEFQHDCNAEIHSRLLLISMDAGSIRVESGMTVFFQEEWG